MSSSDCYACRLNYDDCVYASKASNNERVRHQYCGRNLGRTEYFCCPKVVSRSGVREDVVCGSGDREVCEFLLTGEKFSSDRESASLSQSLWSWILPIIGAVGALLHYLEGNKSNALPSSRRRSGVADDEHSACWL